MGQLVPRTPSLPGVFPLFDPVPASTWNCQGLGLRVEKRE